MEAPQEDTSRLSLPLILVSAYDVASANVLISEIINSNATNKMKTHTPNESESRIWKIENKYYKAEVELYPVADNDTLPLSLADRLEAHIIYITDDEEDEMASERAEERWVRAGGGADGVRLLVCAGAAVDAALDAWARRRRYEPVPLRETPADPTSPASLGDLDDDDDEDDADFPGACGVERVREALHAHTWRGLRRVDTSQEAALADEAELEDEAEVEEDLAQAEAFAAALGALREARAAAAALPAAERRRAAERHTLAFLRSIGVDMHAL